MKLTKAKDPQIDLTEPSEWAEQMVAEFGEFIPILPQTPKGIRSVSMHFQAPADVVDLANTLIACTPRFDKASDVYRAIFWIGTKTLYHLLKGKVKSDKAMGKELYKVLCQQEKYRFQYQRLDDAINGASHIKHSFGLGIITADQRDEEYHKIADVLPSDLKKVFWNKVKQMEAGAKVTELSENKTWGGNRG